MAFQKECYCAEIRELKIHLKVADIFNTDVRICRIYIIGSVCTYHIPKIRKLEVTVLLAYLYAYVNYFIFI